MSNKNDNALKVLAFDLETSPYKIEKYIWNIYDNPWVKFEDVTKFTSILCASWSWIDPRDYSFTEPVSLAVSDFPKDYRKDPYDDSKVVSRLAQVLEEADVYVFHNGEGFDLKVYNTSAIKNGLPPIPTKPSVDTLKVCRRHFRFPNNRLDTVAQVLGLGAKTETGGMELWERCVEGDKTAMKEMVEYCENDVTVLSQLYFALRSFDTKHPAFNLISGALDACPTCGVEGYLKTNPSWIHHATTRAYPRYRCDNCGSWCRSVESIKNHKAHSRSV